MIAKADYQYLDIHVIDMDLPLNAESRESKFDFCILKVGNLCGSGPSLTVDKALVHTSFTYESLKTCFHHSVMKHPTDPTINRMLYLCEFPFFCTQ